MLSYEDLLSKSDLLNRKLILPSPDILRVAYQNEEGFITALCIEYITHQDVFYPITEKGYIFIDSDGNYSTVESSLVILSIGLANVRAIQRNIIDTLLKI